MQKCYAVSVHWWIGNNQDITKLYCKTYEKACLEATRILENLENENYEECFGQLYYYDDPNLDKETNDAKREQTKVIQQEMHDKLRKSIDEFFTGDKYRDQWNDIGPIEIHITPNAKQPKEFILH